MRKNENGRSEPVASIMNEDMTESYIITKEEYLATNLPVREKHHEPFLLSYSNPSVTL